MGASKKRQIGNPTARSEVLTSSNTAMQGLRLNGDGMRSLQDRQVFSERSIPTYPLDACDREILPVRSTGNANAGQSNLELPMAACNSVSVLSTVGDITRMISTHTSYFPQKPTRTEEGARHQGSYKVPH